MLYLALRSVKDAPPSGRAAALAALRAGSPGSGTDSQGASIRCHWSCCLSTGRNKPLLPGLSLPAILCPLIDRQDRFCAATFHPSAAQSAAAKLLDLRGGYATCPEGDRPLAFLRRPAGGRPRCCFFLRGQPANRFMPQRPNGSGPRPTKRNWRLRANCYFRKTFTLGTPEQGEIQIGCDDSYELYVNGHQVGSGSNWKVLDVYDITNQLVPGTNTIAVKATNREQGSAGLVARVLVKQQGGTQVTHSTDATWKAALKEFVGWQKARFNDSQWLAARSFGKMGSTLPWGNEVTVAGRERPFQAAAAIQRGMGHRSQRHRLADRDDVRRVRPDHRLARERAADLDPRRRSRRRAGHGLDLLRRR